MSTSVSLTLIPFPPGRKKIDCARSAARMYVKYIRENPASPPADAGEGGESSALCATLFTWEAAYA